VIFTLPVVAAAGTVQIALLSLQELGEHAVPLNVKVLAPCVAPRPVPVAVTLVPTIPVVTDRLARCGVTVNVKLLLVPAVVVTEIPPVVAGVGMVQISEVALHVPQVTSVALIWTVDVP
jgi:hypothetical protein